VEVKQAQRREPSARLYLVPAALLICVIVQWVCLAGSFYQAVLR
jgi:hypothetical protein